MSSDLCVIYLLSYYTACGSSVREIGCITPVTAHLHFHPHTRPHQRPRPRPPLMPGPVLYVAVAISAVAAVIVFKEVCVQPQP